MLKVKTTVPALNLSPDISSSQAKWFDVKIHTENARKYMVFPSTAIEQLNS